MSKILIVDDVRDNRETLKRVLTRLGHTSDVACDVEEAVQKVESSNFDLVLMDITIPQTRDGEPDIYGGIEATKRIRANPRFRSLPIVAVTAHGFHSQRKAILDSGCCEILEKGPEAFIGRTKEMLVRILGASGDVASTNVEQKSTPKIVENRTTSEAAPLSSSSASTRQAPRATDQQTASDRYVVSAGNLEPHSLITQLTLPETEVQVVNKILQHLAAARELLRRFLSQGQSQCSDEELQESLQKLDRDLGRAQARFASGPGPRGGESLAHWGINGITSLGMDCESLRAIAMDSSPETTQLVGQVQRYLHAIQAALTGREFSKPSPPMAPMETVAPKLLSSVVPEPSSTATTNDQRSSTFNSAKLLIVDDDGEIRLSMERMLMQLGHEAYSCGDGYQALKMLQSQAFDVCLLDLNMPGLGGLEMIKQIRSSPSLSQLPIIVISGSGQFEAAAEAIEMGADDYLTKPPHLPLLRARINACLKQLDLRRAELAKFLPQSVIKASLNNPEKMYSGRLADVSVMFADIRNFSRISDRIGAQETIRWIREVMDRLSTCILSHDGTLVDYVGDEIIAMWGAPHESESHAQHACRCALAIQHDTEQLSQQWRERLGEPFQLGIGIHSGPAVVGNMASQHRFKYGPFGPTVNVASRVQGATKYLRTNILITSAVAQMIPAELAKRRLCKVQVKNIPTPMDLFELRQSASHSDDRDLSYEEALKAFEARDFTTTTRRLANLLTQYPEDGPTQLLMNRLIQCQLENEEFSPVWILPGK